MEKMDKFFLTEVCPFGKRRNIKWKRVGLIGGIGGGLLVLGILFVLPDPEFQKLDRPGDLSVPSIPQGQSPDSNSHYIEGFGKSSPYSTPRSSARSPRQYTASQLVKKEGSASETDKLPMGTTFRARLINTVLSSDNNAPVIGEVADDVFWQNALLIPAGTKALGQSALDDATRRLQVRFHTLVFPEGAQHPLAAIALLQDGSSGLNGNLHSGKLKRQVGRFFGNFVGGLAQGLKDKDSRGEAGIVFEPGSLKNGVLNGITTSSLDQAKSFADESQETKAYLEVPGGTRFLIYLEREFSL